MSCSWSTTDRQSAEADGSSATSGWSTSIPSDLTIRRWGDTDGRGTTNSRRLSAGDRSSSASAARISARWRWLTSTASAPATCYGASSQRPTIVLPEFLPFFMQSDLFFEQASQHLGRVAVAHDQLEEHSRSTSSPCRRWRSSGGLRRCCRQAKRDRLRLCVTDALLRSHWRLF